MSMIVQELIITSVRHYLPLRKELGLEVETLEKTLHVSSPIGTRVSVD